MNKYLKDGRRVIVENETIDGKFIVRTMINVDDGYDSAFEYESDNVFVVSGDQLCDLPPTEIYEKSIAAFNDVISKRRETIQSLDGEITDLKKKLTEIKRELTNEDMETAHTINQLRKFIENPSILIDYLMGKIGYVVTNGNWPTLLTFDKVYKKNLDLRFESEGRGTRRVVLVVQYNTYWYSGTPFESKDDALCALKKKLEYAHMDKPGVMIKEAKKHGITVDQKHIDRYNDIQNKERKKERRELEKKIKDLG